MNPLQRTPKIRPLKLFKNNKGRTRRTYIDNGGVRRFKNNNSLYSDLTHEKSVRIMNGNIQSKSSMISKCKKIIHDAENRENRSKSMSQRSRRSRSRSRNRTNNWRRQIHYQNLNMSNRKYRNAPPNREYRSIAPNRESDPFHKQRMNSIRINKIVKSYKP